MECVLNSMREWVFQFFETTPPKGRAQVARGNMPSDYNIKKIGAWLYMWILPTYVDRLMRYDV